MDVTIIISSAVVSAAISLVGVIASSLIAKSTATKTAKITTKAEMEQLLARQEHADKIRLEDRTWSKEDCAHDAYKKLFAAVSEYIAKPDRNTKSAAITACADARLIARGSKEFIEQLLNLIQCSDAFDGVDSATAMPLLLQILDER